MKIYLVVSSLIIAATSYAGGIPKNFKCEGNDKYGKYLVYAGAKANNVLSRPAVFTTATSTGKTWVGYGAWEILGKAVSPKLNSFVVHGNDDDHYNLVLPINLGFERFTGFFQRAFGNQIIQNLPMLCVAINN